MCVCIYTYTHTHTYIYIERERDIKFITECSARHHDRCESEHVLRKHQWRVASAEVARYKRSVRDQQKRL